MKILQSIAKGKISRYLANKLSIASRFNLWNIAASSIIIAFVNFNFKANLSSFLILQIFSSFLFNLIGILNAEWHVYPFSINVAAIPLVAVGKIIYLSLNTFFTIKFIRNVLENRP